MTREEAKKMQPILVAFAEGKSIQSRYIKGDKSLWYDDEDPSFDDDFEYRIKPESEYRPFANAEECWKEMLKHQPFGWVKDRNGSKFIIENVDSRGFVEVMMRVHVLLRTCLKIVPLSTDFHLGQEWRNSYEKILYW